MNVEQILNEINRGFISDFNPKINEKRTYKKPISKRCNKNFHEEIFKEIFREIAEETTEKEFIEYDYLQTNIFDKIAENEYLVDIWFLTVRLFLSKEDDLRCNFALLSFLQYMEIIGRNFIDEETQENCYFLLTLIIKILSKFDRCDSA